MALDVAGDLAVWFSDFAVRASYQAMVNGAPSGAPFGCDTLDATDGQFVSAGHVSFGDYNKLFYLRADQVATPAEGDTLTVGATVYKISGAPRHSDATRTMWAVPVR
jgi:hypothetical protein